MEKNATVVQNILANDFIVKSPGVVELTVIVASSLILIVLLPRLKTRPGVTLGLIGCYFFHTCLLLIRYNIWLKLVQRG